jgi:pyrroloquinoline quinone biosynthesis protein E
VSLGDWGKEEWHENNQRLQAENMTPEERQQLAQISVRDGIDISLWEQAATYTTESPQKLCPAPFTRASVSSDSRLVPCSRVGNPEVADLGNAKDFEQAWNGPVYQAFRQAHLDGNIPHYCRNCYKNEDQDQRKK